MTPFKKIIFITFLGGIVDLQCCISVMFTAKWISYTYTYVSGIWVLVHRTEEWTLWTHTGSKQAKILYNGKGNSSSTDTEKGRKSPPFSNFLRFYLLKMGVPVWGPDISSFSHWPCPVYLYQSLSNRGLKGGCVPYILWFLCSALP